LNFKDGDAASWMGEAMMPMFVKEPLVKVLTGLNKHTLATITVLNIEPVLFADDLIFSLF
jgi:hypothetical protein